MMSLGDFESLLYTVDLLVDQNQCVDTNMYQVQNSKSCYVGPVGPKGEKGESDGIPGQKGDIGDRGQKGEPGPSGSYQPPEKVRFFVDVKKEFIYAWPYKSHIVKFDNIHRNTMNGYRSTTGQFIVPVNGDYFFSTKVKVRGHPTEEPKVYLRKNEMTICKAKAEMVSFEHETIIDL